MITITLTFLVWYFIELTSISNHVSISLNNLVNIHINDRDCLLKSLVVHLDILVGLHNSHISKANKSDRMMSCEPHLDSKLHKLLITRFILSTY